MAPGGMNMSVGLDLSALQKDLKVLDRDLNSKVGQEKILKIKAVIEMDDPKKELDEYTGQIKKVAREGFEPLYRAIKRLQKAQEGLKFNVGGVAYDVNSIKEAQKYMRDLRKEFNAREKNGTMTADWKRQYVDAQAQMSEWVKATRSVTRELGSYGLLDYDKEAGKIKSLRAAYNKELKSIKAEMASLGDVEPRDLKRREELLTRQIALQEKLNATYKRVSPQKQQTVSDLRAERDAIRLKQKQADIQTRINSLENDRANAKNLTKKISQIQAERSAVGKLITSYEQLAARQRKYGANPAAAEQRVAMLKQEHIALKNLEAEERARMKAVNQNNALFSDQGKLLNRLKTLASSYINIFMIGNLARKIAETTGFFERQQVALEGIIGSATKAAELMSKIKAFAPNSPFQTKQLISYTKQLAAYSIPTDELFEKTKMLADLSAGLGVDMQRLILAYGQVNAASVLRGQELRQFTEAGIPMVQKLADKFSELNGRLVTTGEVFELISKRQVPFEMVSQVLTDMTSAGGQFYHMQENLMGTLYGQIEKLKDLWTLSLNDIGSEANKVIVGIVKGLQYIVKNASSILKGLSAFVIIKNIHKVHLAIKQIGAAAGSAGAAIAGWFAMFGVVFSSLVAYISKMRSEYKKLDRQLDQIHESFQKQVDAAKDGLDEIIKKLNSTTEGTKAYQDAIDSLVSNYSQYITVNDDVIQQLMQMSDAYENIKLAIEKYNEALEKKQQLEATKNRLKEAFDVNALGNWNQYIRGNKFSWDGINNVMIQSKFQSSINKVFDEMLSQNLLSYAEDKDERYLENQSTFRDLFWKYMDAEGLGSMRPDQNGTNGINEYALFSAFASKALFDNDSKRAYENYRMLVEESMGKGTSDYAWLSRIENTFKYLPETLPQKLKALNPQDYTNEYNKAWIEAARAYLEDGGDFNNRRDANGKQYASNEFFDLIATMRREIDNFDQGSIYNVENAMKAYHKALAEVDQEGAAMFSNLIKIFQDGTEEASGRAAAVRETIFNTWSPTSAEMRFARQFLPTDKTYSTTRAKLPQEHISRIEALAQYGVAVDKTETIPHKRYRLDPNRQHSPGDLAEIERLKMEERVIAKLMEGVQDGVTITVQNADGTPLQAQLFDIMDREKNFTGGGGHNREFPDFFNIFKNAYELYKKATQEGGIRHGVEKMKTDQAILSQYGDMFGSPGKIEEFGFMIGNKSVAEIIAENLIQGGMEDGIVDFRAAAQATADELLRYGRANKEERVSFIRMGEQIQKWVTETFTKDTITKWLEEFESSIKNLTVSFENLQTNIGVVRKMRANGNYEMAASLIGQGDEIEDYENMPLSDVIAQYVSDLIGEYRNWFQKSTGVESDVLLDTSPEDIKKYDLEDIRELIESLTDPQNVNNNAFYASPQGKKLTDKLVSALNSLRDEIIKEATQIEGFQYTGNKLSDVLANIAKKGTDSDGRLIEALNISKKYYSSGQSAIKKRVAEADQNADDFLKAYLESNQFDVLFSAYRRPINAIGQRRRIENLMNEEGIPEAERNAVLLKLDEMDLNIKAFNAARGYFAPFFNGLNDYRTARSRAYGVWDDLRNDETAIEAGAVFNQKRNRFDTEGITNPEVLTYINQLNEKLDEVGVHGMKLAKVFKDEALNNIKAFCTVAENSLNSMADIVKGLVSSIQSFVKAFSKAYDVMNDGENPNWIQDAEAMLGDFTENFEMLIAPMSSVLSLIIAITVAITVCGAAATPLLITMAAVVAAAAILAAIIAAFQQHDRNLEHSIEDLKEDVEAFDRAITNLQAAAERSVGFEKLRKNIAATGKELEKATAYAEMARLEKDKKNTDDDKVKEYEQSAQESLDEFLNNLRDVRDELANATEDWADQMGSAIRSAFQNGENAARAFRNTVKTMIGDVIENMLQMAILEPLIESALENWTNSDYLRQKYTKEWTEKDENGNVINRKSFDQDNYLKELLQNIGDPDKAENFYQSMLMIGDTLIDTVNGMPSVLQDFYKHNSELGTLSGGIESVTEDTARRIEALDNSQLGELFAIRTLLEQYLGSTGGFGDSTMASVQAAVVSIASDTSVISRIMQSFENQLNELRTGPSRPLHVTMV